MKEYNIAKDIDYKYDMIEEISDKKTDIKWVNDILINGKKVCGIYVLVLDEYKQMQK